MAGMNARERILAVLNHDKPDRIPTDIWLTGEVRSKLVARLGENWAQALHVDGMAGVWADYRGPALPPAPQGESVNFWGMRYRKTDYGTGSYDEQVYHPLAQAGSLDDLERYRWPSTEWFDYSQLAAQSRRLRDKQVVMCGYMAPFYYHNQLRGLERSLMDPYDDPVFTHELLNRISGFFLRHHRRQFEAAEGLIDLAQVTDDYGMQTGPIISLDIFREFYRPHLQRMIDLCHEFGIKVFHHDDGAIRPFLPDLIEMGIDILNPVQSICPGMAMKGLKQDFGAGICFHGGIDNQQVLPFGTEQQVRQAVRDAIDALACDGTGYILAPCHNIQAVTPVENILAMYDEAWRYGVVR